MKFNTVSLLIMVSIVAYCTLPGVAQSGGPKAVAITPVVDFGSRKKGEVIKHQFAIRNEGTAVLSIARVVSGCDCVATKFDQSIAPGAIGAVHVDLDTAALSGQISRGVTVFTNDPNAFQIELTLRGRVVPLFSVSPGYARFVAVSGEIASAAVAQLIGASDGSDFEILSIESTTPAATATFRPAAASERSAALSGKQWVVAVSLKPDAPVGAIAGYIRARTNNKQEGTISIPVSGFVRPAVAVTPPAVDLGNVTAPLDRMLNVRAFATQPIVVLNAETSISGITAALQPLVPGREYQVRITVTAGTPKGPFAGKLTIRTDSKTSPVIEVPLKGTVL